MVFGCGHGSVLSVDDGTGCKGDVLHVVQSHGFDDVVRRHRTLLEVRVRDTGAETNVRVGGKVEHTIDVHGHRSTNILRAADITFNQHDRTGIKVVLDEGKVATREVVNDDDLVPTTHQTVDEVRADEARSTRDQGSHGLTTKTARIRQMVPSVISQRALC